MSEFADIETGVVGLLAALEESGSPLFAEVRGGAFVDQGARAAALARSAHPVALVMIDGRQRAGADDLAPGAVRVLVVLADRNLRSAESARLGNLDSPGVFLLAQRATAALTGAVIASTWLLSALEERVTETDDRHVVIEQTWLANLIA